MSTATKIEAAPTVYGTVREINPGGFQSTEIRTEEGGTFFVPARGRYAQVRVRTDLEAGMGGTIWINGDAYPVTVRGFSKSGHHVEVTRDAVKGPGLFEPVDGERETFTRRKNGFYKPKGMEGIWWGPGFSVDPRTPGGWRFSPGGSFTRLGTPTRMIRTVPDNRTMAKVLVQAGESITIGFTSGGVDQDVDGEFTIDFDNDDHPGELVVKADIPDSDGREGVIYSERFDEDQNVKGVKKYDAPDEDD